MDSEPLLLLCAVENLGHFVYRDSKDPKSLSEHLLARKYGGKSQPTELPRASFLSKLTFSWISPLLKLGSSKPISLEDIPSLVSEDEGNVAYQKFAHAREDSSSSTRNPVLRAITKVYFRDNIWIAFCAFLRTIAIVVSPLILYAFLNYSNSDKGSLSDGLLIEVWNENEVSFDGGSLSKAADAFSLGRRRHSAGEIVNYIAVDAYRMGEFPWWFHSAWSFAMQLFLSIGVVFWVVGLGALPGIIPLFICGLLNVPFAKALQKSQSQFMMAQDERLRATSEILNSMKIIKLQSWEEKFRNLVSSLREREFKWLAVAQFKKVDIFGTIAYVSQTSWIQSGTVRDNILYGKPMDKNKYEGAIKACALDKDINSFWHGDLTEIGQRGLNMSGGQKQRIQLARAIYSDADIYLLDDPFSAVDAHTAAILFRGCIMEALAKKTVILVTHQVEFLSEFNQILAMEGGQITQSGSYEGLLTEGTAFKQLVSAHGCTVTTLGPSSYKSQIANKNEDMVQPEESFRTNLPRDSSEEDIFLKGAPGVQLTEEETKEIGDVGWKPFWDYIFVSKGTLLLCLALIAHCSFIGVQVVSTYWLAVAIQFPKITSGILICVYSAISTLSSVFVYPRTILAVQLGLKASEAFCSGFTDAIFTAPMLFFDSTPVGRILTRASSDLSVLDFDIPFSIIFALTAVIDVLTVIGIMASITWQVLIVAIPAMVAVKYVQNYYLASARELIRINGTTKAPVINYAAETSLGVVTIRV
ncbi:hypothetical protein ABKV19_009233 [Rosa sericea]